MLSEQEKRDRHCSVDGCKRDYYARGYCNKHYNQVRKYGKVRLDIERGEYGIDMGECTVDHCHSPAIAKGLCTNHYQQVRRLNNASILPETVKQTPVDMVAEARKKRDTVKPKTKPRRRVVRRA